MDKKMKSSTVDVAMKAFFSGTKRVFDFGNKVMPRAVHYKSFLSQAYIVFGIIISI